MSETERLVTVWDARFDKIEEKLNKVVRSTYGAAGKVERRLDSVNDNIARKFGRGIGQTVSNDLDALGNRAGRASTALSGFGLAGIGVAAALGAMTIAAGKAMQAMDFGDELQAAADKLQITSESLQALQFAADETDVPIDQLREGLFKLNGALGAFKTGVGGAKVEKVFAALRLTREDLKGVNDANDLLPILADRIGRISSTAEQVQLARKLGIENLLPLLRQGSTGLKQMEDRARSLGLVLSNETVQGLADSQRQMELASQQIKTNLTGAFSGLATLIAQATGLLADFLVKMRLVADASPRTGAMIAGLFTSIGNPGAALGGIIGDQTSKGRLPTPSAARLAAEMKATFGVKPAAGGFSPTFQGDKGDGKAESEANKRRQRERQLAQEINKIQEDILKTSRDGRESSEERLQFEYSRLETERAQRDEEIKQLEADYKRTKGLEGLSAGEAEQLRGLEDQLLANKRNNARLEALRSARDQVRQQEEAITGFTVEQLRIAEGMATTQAERRRIQLHILELERAQERAALEAKLKADLNVSEASRTAQLAGFDAATAAQRGAVISNTRGPLEQARAEIPQTMEEINQAIESVTAGSLKNLEDQLLGVIQGTQSMGDAFRNVANQIIADLARIAIQQAIIGPLDDLLTGGVSSFTSGLGKLFGGGRATGGAVSAGSLYRVGENGPELFAPNRSGTIIPTGALKAAAAMRPGGGQTVVIQQTLRLTNYGPTTKEFMAEVQRVARSEANRAGAQSANFTLAAMPGRLVQQQKLGR